MLLSNLNGSSCFCVNFKRRAVASGGQWCPATHLKSVPPISRLGPWLLHTSNTVFKKCGPLFWFLAPPSGFWPPCCLILATGLLKQQKSPVECLWAKFDVVLFNQIVTRQLLYCILFIRTVIDACIIAHACNRPAGDILWWISGVLAAFNTYVLKLGRNEIFAVQCQSIVQIYMKRSRYTSGPLTCMNGEWCSNSSYAF